METPNQEVLEALNAAKWDELAPKLLKFIIYLMREKGISDLPNGMTAAELVQDIVLRVYKRAQTGGTKGRNWDPEKHPNLLLHLKWIARSDLSGKGLLGRSRDDDLIYTDSQEELDALSNTTDTQSVTEEDRPLIAALREEVAGDPNLEDVVAAIELGFMKSGEIAKETGIPLSCVYELRRKLQRKAEAAREKVRVKKENEAEK